MQLSVDVKDVQVKVNFEINMSKGDIYDVVKLNDQGTSWFYGKKSLNNKCSIDFSIGGKQYSDSQCIALSDQGRGIMSYKNQWQWATGAGPIAEGDFSINITKGLETRDTEYTGDYFKVNDKLVHLEPIMVVVNEYNKREPIRFITHPAFSGSKRQAMIEFRPEY